MRLNVVMLETELGEVYYVTTVCTTLQAGGKKINRT
jgi:hypothetical protein